MSLGFHRARTPWLALALFGMACSDARQPPQPASFDRPTDVDFVCIVEEKIQPLWRCEIEVENRALHALVTQSARGEIAAVNLWTDRILDNRRDIPGYTFVPTGELPIAIEVSALHPEITYVASYGSRDVRAMRTKVLVGLTTEAAELQDPVSLTIDATDGTFGGTPSDMVLTPDESALLVTLSDVGKLARLPLTQCAEGDDGCEPGLIDRDGITFVDLPVSTPDAPVPVVVEAEYQKVCGDYQRPPMPEIPEPTTPPSGTGARPVALAIDTSCEDCGEGRVLIADESLSLIHVLDMAALASGGDALLPPIPTGSPTRDLVITPRVPVTLEDDEASTYYVYAIDAVDGSVMVLENDALLAVNRDPDGRVDRLPIPSRSGTPEPLALSLEVITPEYDVTDDDRGQYVRSFGSSTSNTDGRQFCIDDTHTEVTQRRLRGVFLTAAMADGTVRIIDVHDTGLRVCRDCDLDPSDGERGPMSAGPRAPVLVRHHPRLVTDPISIDESDRERDELRPITTAFASVQTGQFAVRNNGTVASPLSPTLACFECADGFEQALPDPDDQVLAEDDSVAPDAGVVVVDAGADGSVDGGIIEEEVESICRQALVCGVSDPWAAPPTTYSVGYEAALPNSRAGDGRFVAPDAADNVTNLLEVHSDVSFCERGVLGRDDIGGARDASLCQPFDVRTDRSYVPGSAPLVGDQLVVVADVLSDSALAELDRRDDKGLNRSARDLEVCAQLRATLEEDDTAVMGFEIIAAFEDRVAIRNRLMPPFDTGEFSDLDWVGLQKCIGEGRMSFFVRAQDGFLVQSGTEGFVHNVIANANGRCVVDAMTGPRQSHRTWTGCEYRDERIQFVLDPFIVQASDVVREPGDGYGVLLQFGVNTTASPLVMNAAQIGFGITTLVPARLRFSPTDEHLYLVDTYQGGLIPIDLDPFTDTPITSFY